MNQTNDSAKRTRDGAREIHQSVDNVFINPILNVTRPNRFQSNFVDNTVHNSQIKSRKLRSEDFEAANDRGIIRFIKPELVV